LPLCKSSCERYHEKCFGLLSAMNETDKLLPCDMFPDTGCNAPPYSDELPPGFLFFILQWPFLSKKD